MNSIRRALNDVAELLGQEAADEIDYEICGETPVIVQLRGKDIIPETLDKPTLLLLMWATGQVWYEPALDLPEWAIKVRGTWDSVWS